MKIKDCGDGTLAFWCLGCKDHHSVNVKGSVADTRGAAVWTFNGDLNHPTLHPSISCRNGHYAPHHTGKCWCDYNREEPDTDSFTCEICHSFVVDGKIQYLSDCTRTGQPDD